MLLLLWRAAFPPASRLSEHLCVLLFQMICLERAVERAVERAAERAAATERAAERAAESIGANKLFAVKLYRKFYTNNYLQIIYKFANICS